MKLKIHKEDGISSQSSSGDIYNKMLEKHEKRLKNMAKKNLSVTKNKMLGESARRLRLLRDSLDITAAQMATLCNFTPSKYNRLENGSTQLTRQDVACICMSILKSHKLLIEPEWLLLKVSNTPASLINLKQVQQKVQEYTDNVLENSVSSNGVGSTINIFLEMEQLTRIHNNRTKFIMVNDNRLLPQYKKGDYVGGIILPKEMWYVLKDGYQPCIVEFKKDEKVLLRNVYLTEQENLDIFILATNTNVPELVSKDKIESIAIVFYHRYNSEELTKILSLTSIKDTNIK